MLQLKKLKKNSETFQVLAESDIMTTMLEKVCQIVWPEAAIIETNLMQSNFLAAYKG